MDVLNRQYRVLADYVVRRVPGPNSLSTNSTVMRVPVTVALPSQTFGFVVMR